MSALAHRADGNDKPSLSVWKYLNKGLVVTRDESRVIGTFHVAQDHPEKDYVRALVLRAEALERALYRVVSAATVHNSVTEEVRRASLAEAHELLDELAQIRYSGVRRP